VAVEITRDDIRDVTASRPKRCRESRDSISAGYTGWLKMEVKMNKNWQKFVKIGRNLQKFTKIHAF